MTTACDTYTVIVDDTNTDMIMYSEANWKTGGRQGEFNLTTHGTNVGGSYTIIFIGTSVSVYGTVEPVKGGTESVVSTYYLDDDPTQTFSTPSSESTQVQILFYQSPTLANTMHTLVVKSDSTSYYWLDYILYTKVDASFAASVVDPPGPLANPTSPTSSPPSTVVSPTSPTSSSPGTLVSPTSHPVSPTSPLVGTVSPLVSTISPLVSATSNSRSTSSPQTSQSPTIAASLCPSPSQHSKPSTAIIGGTLGGVLVLLAAVLLFLRFQRNNNNVSAPRQSLSARPRWFSGRIADFFARGGRPRWGPEMAGVLGPPRQVVVPFPLSVRSAAPPVRQTSAEKRAGVPAVAVGVLFDDGAAGERPYVF